MKFEEYTVIVVVIFMSLLFVALGYKQGLNDARGEAIAAYAGKFVITNNTEMVWVWTGRNPEKESGVESPKDK